jgi:hypothetical protein
VLATDNQLPPNDMTCAIKTMYRFDKTVTFGDIHQRLRQ